MPENMKDSGIKSQNFAAVAAENWTAVDVLFMYFYFY